MRITKSKMFAVLFLCTFLLVGCSEKKVATTNADTETIVDNDGDVENAERKEYVTVEESDWKVKDGLCADLDNVYMIDIGALGGISYEYGSVCDMEPFNDNILVVYSDTKDVCSLYEIDQYNLAILKSVSLPQGEYTSDCLKVYEDEVTILNSKNCEIYSFDYELVDMGTKKIHIENVTEFIQSSNNKNIYYYDSSTVYKYDIDAEEDNILFEDESYRECNIEGIIGDDQWLVYSYYSDDLDGITYEVRDIHSGEIVYSDTKPLVDAESVGDTYIIRYLHDNMYHILCGDVNSRNTPQVLSLYGFANDSGDVDYAEMDFNLNTGYVNVSEKYLLTYQWDEIEENEQSKLDVHLYDKSTGEMRDVNIALSDTNSKYNTVSDAVYIEDENMIIFSMCNGNTKLFVWDLDMESSEPIPEENRLFDFTDITEYDEDTKQYLLDKAARISEKHGVDIFFEDFNGCIIYDYGYDIINNALMVDFSLDALDRELSKYPIGMIAQLDCGYGSKLKIYLASDLYGGELDSTVGVQGTDANNTCMVLEIQGKFDDVTFHHEMFHAIENYIVYKSGTMDTDDWYALNPEGHMYAGGYTANHESGDYSGVGKYFVRPYSKAYSSEDRADIMGFSIGEYSELCQSMENVDELNAKLAYLSKVIRENFDTTGWPEKTYWEDKIN